MALKHQLSVARTWIPELHTPIFGPTKNPLVVRRKSNAEHKVLIDFISGDSRRSVKPSATHFMALKSLDAFPHP